MKREIEAWLFASAERSDQAAWWVFSQDLGRFKLSWVAVYRVLGAAWLAVWLDENSVTAAVLFSLAKRMVKAINSEFPVKFNEEPED